MHIKMQRCAVILWLCALAAAEAQDCTLGEFIRSEMYNSNFNITGLSDLYSPGKSVRVPCNVGFVGSFQIVCIDGRWAYRGQNCEKLHCTPPVIANGGVRGDAQSYMEGALLSYTCDRNYRPVHSRSPKCTKIGGRVEWSPTPECESIKCSLMVPPLRGTIYEPVGKSLFYPGEGVTVTCQETYFIGLHRDTSKEITCQDNGQWDFPSTTCKELHCTPPVIANGGVRGDAQSYMEDALLSYTCDRNYRPVHSVSPKCTKTGGRVEWSPTPECESVKCGLTVPPTRGTIYEPFGKSLFYPGESVTVTCQETYFIGLPGKTSKEITCQDGGQWDSPSTTCKEVICTRPLDNKVYQPFWWRLKRLGETVTYRCVRGYRIPQGYTEAICTREGWFPNPLCEAED